MNAQNTTLEGNCCYPDAAEMNNTKVSTGRIKSWISTWIAQLEIPGAEDLVRIK